MSARCDHTALLFTLAVFRSLRHAWVTSLLKHCEGSMQILKQAAWHRLQQLKNGQSKLSTRSGHQGHPRTCSTGHLGATWLADPYADLVIYIAYMLLSANSAGGPCLCLSPDALVYWLPKSPAPDKATSIMPDIFSGTGRQDVFTLTTPQPGSCCLG